VPSIVSKVSEVFAVVLRGIYIGDILLKKRKRKRQGYFSLWLLGQGETMHMSNDWVLHLLVPGQE
jgi:hypothetical protein